MESVLFEIYEACSLVVCDHWHSLGLLRDSESNFFSGSIAPLKNADLSADTVLSISSFVRSGSGSPGSELFYFPAFPKVPLCLQSELGVRRNPSGVIRGRKVRVCQ